MTDGIQTFLSEAGESGCYAICLVKVAEKYKKKELDLIKSLELGIEKRCILYNKKDRNDNDNFYVINPATFLFYLTGKHWNCRKENYPYTAKRGEYIIERWERNKTGVITGHFDMQDFHPIENSLTVQYGKIVSYRVLKPVK
jgi:hypothetical protein